MTTFEPPRPPALDDLPERPEGAPPPRSTVVDEPDRWFWWSGFAALVGGLIVVLLFQLVGVVIAVAAGADADNMPSGMNIGLTFVQEFIFIAAALFMAQVTLLPRREHFGLRKPDVSFLKVVGIMVGVFVAFYILSAIWVAAIGENPDEELPDELGADESDVALVFVLLMVTLGAPVAEEFLFRGFLFRALRNWKGVIPATMIGGAVFGLIHAGSADAVALLPLALLGAGLCLLYHWTGSLYPCVALHAINNAIAFSVSQDWDWQIPIVIAGALPTSLLLAWLLGKGIDRSRQHLQRRAAPPDPAPG